MCLLSACAAADPADVPGPASRPITGASGQLLVGRFAMGQTDVGTAASDLLAALADDPQNLELRQQAFAAAVMAGRPEALTLARDLPDSPAASLVLANDDVRNGNWRAAEAKYGQLPAQGATQLLQPLLRAWAEQGSGATDEALNTLRPFIEGTRFRGVFALHAAMINDLAGRQGDAARLYRLAMVEYGGLNLRLGTVVASWQARGGQEAEARATIRATVQSSPELAIAEPALQLTAGTQQVKNAADGIAEAYLALAAALQRQDATDFSLSLLRLALDLRPDFTAARLLAADIQSREGQIDAASAMLQELIANEGDGCSGRSMSSPASTKPRQPARIRRTKAGCRPSPRPAAYRTRPGERAGLYLEAAALLGRARRRCISRSQPRPATSPSRPNRLRSTISASTQRVSTPRSTTRWRP